MSAQSLLSERMIEFNLLPSRTLHPSRHSVFAPPAITQRLHDEPAYYAGWHRHWSRYILRMLGLEPVLDANRPELAVALLRPAALLQLVQWVGATLCGPRLRRTIAGAEVRELLAASGDEVLAFARGRAARHHPGLPESAEWEVTQTTEAIDTLGRATLLAGLSEAGPPIVRRAELKLPEGPLVDSPLAPRQALALSFAVLKDMDSTWHSSFPAIL
jgi:type III secretion protein K